MTSSRQSSDTNMREIGSEYEDGTDILAEGSTGESIGNELASTARAFNSKIQRLKKEQEKADGASELAAKARHQIILESMLNIRKSLIDVCRVDLGDRFFLRLELDDWQGWPRHTIKLVDKLLPQAEYPFFRVTAHDRQEQGNIEFIYGDEKKPVAVDLSKHANVSRIYLVLKRCARAFLDTIAVIVLETERTSELDEQYLKNKSIADFQEDDKHSPIAELNDDLFSEGGYQNDLLEQLPTLDNVNELPGLTPSEKNKT